MRSTPKQNNQKLSDLNDNQGEEFSLEDIYEKNEHILTENEVKEVLAKANTVFKDQSEKEQDKNFLKETEKQSYSILKND